MIDIIIERSAIVNRVPKSDISSNSQKTFVIDARAMAVGAMLEVGISKEIIREQLNANSEKLKELIEIHKCQIDRGGYYFHDYTGIMEVVNQPILSEGDYQSVKEIDQRIEIIELENQIKELQIKLEEKCS